MAVTPSGSMPVREAAVLWGNNRLNSRSGPARNAAQDLAGRKPACFPQPAGDGMAGLNFRAISKSALCAVALLAAQPFAARTRCRRRPADQGAAQNSRLRQPVLGRGGLPRLDREGRPAAAAGHHKPGRHAAAAGRRDRRAGNHDVLFGDSSVNGGWRSGGRLQAGYWFDPQPHERASRPASSPCRSASTGFAASSAGNRHSWRGRSSMS